MDSWVMEDEERIIRYYEKNILFIFNIMNNMIIKLPNELIQIIIVNYYLLLKLNKRILHLGVLHSRCEYKLYQEYCIDFNKTDPIVYVADKIKELYEFNYDIYLYHAQNNNRTLLLRFDLNYYNINNFAYIFITASKLPIK